jgi:hypothetical protein
MTHGTGTASPPGRVHSSLGQSERVLQIWPQRRADVSLALVAAAMARRGDAAIAPTDPEIVRAGVRTRLLVETSKPRSAMTIRRRREPGARRRAMQCTQVVTASTATRSKGMTSEEVFSGADRRLARWPGLAIVNLEVRRQAGHTRGVRRDGERGARAARPELRRARLGRRQAGHEPGHAKVAAGWRAAVASEMVTWSRSGQPPTDREGTPLLCPSRACRS